MDLGRDVLTRTLLGNTDSEKVFTPWWITLHHYFVYFLVVLGKQQYVFAKFSFDVELCAFVYSNKFKAFQSHNEHLLLVH